MEYLAINQATWNKRTRIHLASEFYDVDGFVAGKSSLNPLEVSLVGEVKGKSLLHLQCHFGQDTISFARMGAEVTGVDLSDVAIENANTLVNRINQENDEALSARFIQSDVCSFESTQLFDHVFTSYGTIIWLPDLTPWAKTIASSLKKGGQFTIVDFHPLHDVFDGYSYFHNEQPDVDEEGTYTENCDGVKSACVTWSHPISEVVNALIGAGLVIEQLDEHANSPYNCFEGLEQKEDGYFYYFYKNQQVPLVYSIIAKNI
mgnify:CR=1 FL=1